MANWTKDRVFNNADDFLNWLDQNFGDYINKHISENHVHHTWSPSHTHNRTNTTLQLHKNMRNFHVNTNGWSDIAQSISIGSDGKIVLGRDIRIMPVSATGYNGTPNWHPFAYEMIGNFDKGNDVLQGKQLESSIKVSRYFQKKGKTTRFHRELLLNGRVPKSCPGTGIDKGWFMNLVNSSKFDVGKSVATKVSPSPVAKVASVRTESSQNYLAKGDSGSAVKTMQQKLIQAGYSLPKYGADGKLGGEGVEAIKDLQRKHGLTVDGLFGVASSKALDNELKGKNTQSKQTWTKVTGNWTGQTLKPGQYGEPVRQLQTKLANNNPPFYPNKGAKNDGVDTYYGNDTKDAVARFQTYYGLSIDGLAGKQVYSKLGGKSTAKASSKPKTSGSAVVPYPGKLIRVGSRGKDVERVQRAVGVKADGIFGAGTEKAVKSYQSRHGLKSDGIVGKSTWSKMF